MFRPSRSWCGEIAATEHHCIRTTKPRSFGRGSVSHEYHIGLALLRRAISKCEVQGFAIYGKRELALHGFYTFSDPAFEPLKQFFTLYDASSTCRRI